MNLYPLKDLKTIPDIVQEYKPAYLKSQPLVIDNGEYKTYNSYLNNKYVIKYFIIILN